MVIFDREEIMLVVQKPVGRQLVCYCMACHHSILSYSTYRKHHLTCKTFNRLRLAYDNGIINENDNIITCLTKFHKCILCNKIMRTDRARAKRWSFILCIPCLKGKGFKYRTRK